MLCDCIVSNTNIQEGMVLSHLISYILLLVLESFQLN